MKRLNINYQPVLNHCLGIIRSNDQLGFAFIADALHLWIHGGHVQPHKVHCCHIVIPVTPGTHPPSHHLCHNGLIGQVYIHDMMGTKRPRLQPLALGDSTGESIQYIPFVGLDCMLIS